MNLHAKATVSIGHANEAEWMWIEALLKRACPVTVSDKIKYDSYKYDFCWVSPAIAKLCC